MEIGEICWHAPRHFKRQPHAAGVAAKKAAAVATGVPYLTFFQLIPMDSPTAPATTPYHGDFTLVVSVGTPSGSATVWNEAKRQPGYRAYGRYLFNDFNTGIPSAWTLTGTPAIPVAASGSGVGDLGADQAVKFVQTGRLARSLDTTGWTEMILTAKIVAPFLAASDTFTFEISSDGGVNWTTLSSTSDVPVPDVLADVEATAISAPIPASASDNPNVQIRITLTGASVSAVVYLDDLQIKGL